MSNLDNLGYLGSLGMISCYMKIPKMSLGFKIYYLKCSLGVWVFGVFRVGFPPVQSSG
jgi:hypothetical protein